MIPFNQPAVTGIEEAYIHEAIEKRKLSGDGDFTKACHRWLEENTHCQKACLTTSCTSALEASALLAEIEPGDEVIMPSYTFVSTANAFVLRGARIVFVDIRPDTMNIDETRIEPAITDKTKAIVAVHYAGVSCDMKTINRIAGKHHLLVVEDAAQGVLSTYQGQPLGSIGDIGCYSFHETKNYTSGEGGALLVNDARFAQRAEIIREKGTNRSQFFRGQVDKYTWVDIGSSYLPSELNAAFLYAQLQHAEEINQRRLKIWHQYYETLHPLVQSGHIELPFIPEDCQHNAHMFYIKTENLQERTALIEFLKERGVAAVFHYVPLHLSPAGKRYGRFDGEDRYTTTESERLLRLPLYDSLQSIDVSYIAEQVRSYYQ